MCRNIRTLANFEPPADETELRAAALQYVRKVSGMAKPTKGNAALFDEAVDAITQITTQLIANMESHSPPRNREIEAAKAKARSAQRFGERV
jgi:hypothetical protein